MGGLLLLVGLCIVMAVASFLAGALPLSMTLSQSQLRLISSIGVGVLVGTSLVVIIPEGIETAVTPAEASHLHKVRSLVRRSPWALGIDPRDIIETFPVVQTTAPRDTIQSSDLASISPRIEIPQSYQDIKRRDDGEEQSQEPSQPAPEQEEHEHEHKENETEHAHSHEVPTLEIGFSMIAGFILMFLIDRLPRHATETLRSGPETRHMSLDDLGGGDTASIDEEADGFLNSLAPTPRKARSLATTTGLVIHAAADGIAMGASATSSNMRLGFVIFIAIMIHKAPAAFGLTSVLLKQGLSKRAARGHLVIFSLAAPVGAFSTWIMITLLGGDHLQGNSGQWWTGMLLLFSGGTFLYVAMQAMQEDTGAHSHDHASGMNGYSDGNSTHQRKAKGPQMRDTIATVVGMGIPLLAQLGH
ncbi:zinc transporter ZIP9-A [Trichoderma asperellum]|uniref:Zinc transporter ZIP9-A n=1 Tax=Trichoderma asperellum TaxID=101201 RepID=A0A6V8QX94_TRIAP|nr:ZIP zinc transporter-domain-containing protein [Trichoderma asperelloides]GFP57257.1 zinc transporter ZIP9-A [Trichoderma asperellum]